ncbi:regulatory protein RecX [Paenibacillaceae bacterium WGS1546]|uniref:regulatory protein RecX n=1 Tax=Cohnella sp. WGS1546 TaxID=3366810 RepID=UPI00372D0FD3
MKDSGRRRDGEGGSRKNGAKRKAVEEKRRRRALGAIVTGVEAHMRKPHMYRIWLKLEVDPEDAEPATDAAIGGGEERETGGGGKLEPGAGKEREPGLSAERGPGRDGEHATRSPATGESAAAPPNDDWNDEVDALILKAQRAREHEQKRNDRERSERTDDRGGAPGLEGQSISAENEDVITVHEDTLVGWRLLTGRRLTGDEVETLRQDELKEEAYRVALYILERRARTTAELAAALKRKGYGREVVEACVERLKAHRMVDDAAFARRFAEQRATGQRKGRMLIRQELLQRGIDRKEAERALEELDGDAERDAALALARKKWPQAKGNDRERKLKVLAMLLRRGFPPQLARSATWQAASEAGEADGEEFYDGGDDYGSYDMDE